MRQICAYCRNRLVNRVCERCGRRWQADAEPPKPLKSGEEVKRPLARANMTNAQRMAMAGGSSGRIDAVSNAERLEQAPTKASRAAANVSNSQRVANAGGSGHVDAVSNIERIERNAMADGQVEDVHSDSISNKQRRQNALDAGGTESEPVVRRPGPRGKNVIPVPETFDGRVQVFVEASKDSAALKQLRAAIEAGEYPELTPEEYEAATAIVEKLEADDPDATTDQDRKDAAEAEAAAKADASKKPKPSRGRSAAKEGKDGN